MPVYEYECRVCGKRFEMRRHFGGPQPTACPDGHEAVHRVFVAPTLIFKGSGFYVTDNSRNGRVAQAGSKDTESSKSEKQESTKEVEEPKAKEPKAKESKAKEGTDA